MLLADAAITGATALLMVAGASPLGDLLELPVTLLAAAGLVLVPYVAFLFWLARQDALSREGVMSVIALNIGWAVGCVYLLFSDQVEPNALGVTFIAVNIFAVLIFADAQEMMVIRHPGSAGGTAVTRPLSGSRAT